MFFKSVEKHVFKKTSYYGKGETKRQRYRNRQSTEEEFICLISTFEHSQPH